MERQKQSEVENQRSWVLDYFIDPNNPSMDYDEFSEILLSTALGNLKSAGRARIESGMRSLFKDINNARRFNDNYIGHMLSEASIPAMVAHMQATRLGSNSVAPEVSKMETKLEPEGIRFLMDLVGYDKDKASGTFTSGGSMAAFTALTVARKKVQEKYENKDSLLNKLFPDRDKSPRKLYVFTTPMVHYCFHKALDFLGGQNRQIRSVSVATKDYKMSPDDLRKKVLDYKRQGKEIMAIYAIAGETETGLVDPLKEIADIGQEFGIFTIADAAYGAPYRWSRKGNLFEHLHRFDAIIVDGHKALYTPYPNGAVLFRDVNDHVLFGRGVDAAYVQMSNDDEGFRKALQYNISQTKEEEEENKAINYMLGKKRPEGSGSAGSILSTVATKRTLGEEGLRQVYEITLDRIDHLYQKIESSRWFKPTHQPDVNVLCFTLSDMAEKALGFPQVDPKDQSKRKEVNKLRERILEKVRHNLNMNKDQKSIEGSTGYFLSSTDLPSDEIDIQETRKQGKEVRMKQYVLRAVLMNPRTTEEILDTAVAQMESVVDSLL